MDDDAESDKDLADFTAWLKCQGLPSNTSASTVARVRRLSTAYGDLRLWHERDRLAQVLAELTYRMEDERRGRPNPSRVEIKGNLRTGLASLKNAVTLFRSYVGGSQGEDSVDAAKPRTQRSKTPFDDLIPQGFQILSNSYEAMGHNPVELVSRSAIWAHPKVVAALMGTDPHAAWFPYTRRKKSGEVRGAVVQGVQLDDNTYANLAIKLAAFGKRGAQGFHACHVWPGTCYDPRYHTSIANLTLLPAPIAGLSDHDPEVVSVLQYRAFQLFGWKPDECAIPHRPSFYPGENLWRPIPQPTPAIERAVEKWASGNDG